MDGLLSAVAGALLMGVGWLVDRGVTRHRGIDGELRALSERLATVEASLAGVSGQLDRISDAVLGVRP